MYFWRIEKLKTSMATKPLTDREVLPYLIASVMVMAITLGFSRHAPIISIWDDIASIFDMLVAVIGTIYIYKQNNGKNGQHFLQRYIAISWVVSLRIYLGLIIIYFILREILLGAYVTDENTALIEFIYFSVSYIIIYWRVGHHVHDLAQKTLTQENI